MSDERDLIRALAEDLAIEILAAYAAEDFADADFTSLGRAIAYLAEHGEDPGPSVQELFIKIEAVQAVRKE